MKNLKQLCIDCKDLLKKYRGNLVFSIIFLVICGVLSYFQYSILSLILVVLFLVIRGDKKFFGMKAGSKWTKGVCYLGLGIVIILGILTHNTDSASILYYTATMCIIEFVDLFFEFIEANKIEENPMRKT